MNEFDLLFRRRISFPANETISFERLNTVLERTALAIPFENLRVFEGKRDAVTKNYLIDKIIVNNEGGLCYELNAILYLFLMQNGFDVRLTRGITFKSDTQQYVTLGKTHVVILLRYNDTTYLVDTGFGANLSLNPLPLSGEVFTSTNGEFRVKKLSDGPNDYAFEMKIKHKDTDWKIGYAFDSSYTFTDLDECNEVQSTVIEHPESTFNKHPLITKLTDQGNVTLTDTSFTQWVNGDVTKEEVDIVTFKELLERHFGIRK